MNYTEYKRLLSSQNRLKVYKSKNNKNYLYDAFSQNLFPVKKEISDFFEIDDTVITEDNEKEIQYLCDKLSKFQGIQKFSRLPETHLTVNFSSKCNLNCTYCYREKDNKNTMTIDKAFKVLEYADKYFKVNNDEIIFSLDMTAEALLDYDEIIQFNDKLVEYENLYIKESDVVSGSSLDFFNILKKDLYQNVQMSFSGVISENFKKILLDNNLYRAPRKTSYNMLK